MMGKEVLLIAKCFSFFSLFSLHQKFIQPPFVSIQRLDFQEYSHDRHGYHFDCYSSLLDGTWRFFVEIFYEQRERSSCDSSVEQISSHAYAHARPGSCQAMRRIRVANLYDKHFHRGQPVRVNTLVKKRWQTNGYRLFLPFEIGYLHCFVLVDSLLLGRRKRMTFKIIIYHTSPKLIQSTHSLMNSNRGTWHSRL